MNLFSRFLLATTLLLPAFGQEVPRRAPEFVVQGPQQPQKLLSSTRGKVVLIEFLSTTCPHCQHGAKMISNINKELGPKGFQPLGVAFNEGAIASIGEFMKTNGVNYPLGISDRDTVFKFLQRDPNSRGSVPQYVFIDKKGNIVIQTPPDGDPRWADEGQLRAQIEKMLAEPLTTTTSTKSKPTVKKRPS